jgi:hypothetical protein
MLSQRSWSGGQRRGPADQDRDEDDEDFREVAGEQVVDELADVRVDHPPLLDGADDGGEVVVGDHHVGGLLGDLRPLDPHRDADVGRLEGGGVVDPVAGHRHDPAAALQALHDPQLVLGGDPGEDGRGPGHALPFLGRARLQVAGVDRAQGLAARIPVDPELAGDLGRGHRLVAGDHDDPDPRVSAGGDGVARLFAQGVGHAHEPDEGQVAPRVPLRGAGLQVARGQGQHAEGLGPPGRGCGR